MACVQFYIWPASDDIDKSIMHTHTATNRPAVDGSGARTKPKRKPKPINVYAWLAETNLFPQDPFDAITLLEPNILLGLLYSTTLVDLPRDNCLFPPDLISSTNAADVYV